MICRICSTSLDAAATTCDACHGAPFLETGEQTYRFDEVLGRARSSTSYRATIVGSRTEVCVKELRVRGGSSSEEVDLFRREAALLRQLDHPRIPRYLDSSVAADLDSVSLFLVREFIPGQNLREEMAVRRYREDQILKILLQTVEILHYLHGLRPPVIHRDIKPENLIRLPSDEIVLVDFGAVKDVLHDNLAIAAAEAGTLGFMAPEQFDCAASPATDLYSVGALALLLLSRREPANMLGDSHVLDWRPHVQAEPAFVQLLEDLLQPSPTERPQNARTVRNRINEILATMPPGERDPVTLS